MIFENPSGAPELACEACGCRWFDRHDNTCYECGEPVAAAEIAEYETALAAYQAEKGIEPAPDPALE